MIKRTLETSLKQASKQYPVVLLTGPRQSGKTTLCRAVFNDKPYVSFENPDHREFAQKDPRGLLNKYSEGAIFDEIQRCPDILSYLQGIVDEHPGNGRYILTGSQNILLLKSVQQSLAGRVAILRLLPFSYAEIAKIMATYSLDEILYTGGYPRIFDRKLNPTDAMRNYTASYLERDVRQIINVKNLSNFQKFLKLCAGRIGQVLNLSSIGNDLGVSHMTIKEWLSVLETSYVIYLLPAYYRNFKKRIIKSPKLYFHDVGLASYLLGIEKPEHMNRDPLMGNLFENYIVTEVIKYFWSHGRNAPLYFFRDNIGNEVDLLVEKARQVAAIEIKAGQTVNNDWFKGLEYLRRVMGKTVLSRHLIYAGKEEYVREGVGIWPFRHTFKMMDSLEK